jgi:hypothetical protein
MWNRLWKAVAMSLSGDDCGAALKIENSHENDSHSHFVPII